MVADAAWDTPIGDLSAALAWLGALCYTLQIYYDFSGYSDMAIGLGKLFGFHFLDNFNYPYLSPFGDGVLAAVAHLPVHLVPGLCVHPPGRKPEGPVADLPESLRCVAAHRRMARGQLDVSLLGPLLFSAAVPGKAGASGRPIPAPCRLGLDLPSWSTSAGSSSGPLSPPRPWTIWAPCSRRSAVPTSRLVITGSNMLP